MFPRDFSKYGSPVSVVPAYDFNCIGTDAVRASFAAIEAACLRAQRRMTRPRECNYCGAPPSGKACRYCGTSASL